MKTILITHPFKKKNIRKASRILKAGGLVAVPTETVYGLAANALNPKAVKKIFKVKGRPQDNPVIVHIASRKKIKELVAEIPAAAAVLMKKYWPGPLTIVFKKSAAIPEVTSAGLPTVAVRMPKNKIILSLIRESGFPLAAPSANVSGRPSPTTIEDVLEDLAEKIDCAIDGGSTYYGIESTVVDVSGKVPTLLRPGSISIEQLRSTIGKVKIAQNNSERPKSPGMKYKHYAPKAKLIIIEGKKENIAKKIQSILSKKKNEKTGVITTQHSNSYRYGLIQFVGSDNNRIARNLFKALRAMDRLGVELILAEGIPEKGTGHAIMNRLRKAAGYKVIKV
ncbi:threonylcarbamoyl-AMP synthase [bacterium]|nr:threonylcarbamoyl-AMP synthase [bacterium]